MHTSEHQGLGVCKVFSVEASDKYLPSSEALA